MSTNMHHCFSSALYSHDSDKVTKNIHVAVKLVFFVKIVWQNRQHSCWWADWWSDKCDITQRTSVLHCHMVRSSEMTTVIFVSYCN